MKIVLFSTDLSGFQLIEGLEKDDSILSIVFPANREGTKKVLELERNAKERGLSVIKQPKKKDIQPFVNDIIDLAPDIGISWFYSQMIPNEVLNLFPETILNMHGGKIPEYRGASVLQWAIINGEEEIGVTWHSMSELVDAGPIWQRASVPIEDQDNAIDVRNKIIAKGIELFISFWPKFKRGLLIPEPPQAVMGKTWPQRRELDSLLPERMTRKQLYNFFRALCDPWPRPFIVRNNIPFEIIGIVPEIKELAENLFEAYTLSDGQKIYLKIREKKHD